MHANFKPLLDILDRTHWIMSGVIIADEDFAELIEEIRKWSIEHVALPDGSVALYTFSDDSQLMRSFLLHWSVEPLSWFELREEDRLIESGTWQGKVEGRVVHAYTGMLDRLFGYIVAEASDPIYLPLVIEAIQTPEFSEIDEMTSIDT